MRPRTSAARRSAVLLFLSLTGVSLCAQQSVTADDYARAEKLLPGNVDRLVSGTVKAFWIGNSDRFWYRKTQLGQAGSAFVVVNAATGAEEPAFDHAKLAATLGALTGRTLDARQLPFPGIEFSPDLRSVTVFLGPRRFVCDRSGATCTPQNGDPENEALSPDGKRAAFIRDWNLWVRDAATGAETQLTRDGVKDFGYATDNAGWATTDRPVVLWSPDSKKIATFQQDQRDDGDMYIVETKVGHPVLHQWKYPLPGDPVVTTIQRVIIDVDSGKMVRLQMPPDQHR